MVSKYDESSGHLNHEMKISNMPTNALLQISYGCSLTTAKMNKTIVRFDFSKVRICYTIKTNLGLYSKYHHWGFLVRGVYVQGLQGLH